MMNRLTLAAGTSVLALTLTACGVMPHSADTSAEAETTTPAETETIAAPAQDTPAEIGFNDELYLFGETVTYEDGLAITVGEPVESTLSEMGSAAPCQAGDPITLFEVTLVNGTDATYSPVMAAGLSAVSKSTDYPEYAEPVFDTLEDGTDIDDLTFMSDLRPGMRGQYTQGYCGTDLMVIADLSEDMDGSRGEVVFNDER